MLFGADRPDDSPLCVLSPEDVVARLAEGASPGAALAFDADGTLWSGDIGIDAFEALLEKRGVRGLALSSLRTEAQRATASAGTGRPSSRAASARSASMRAVNESTGHR